MLLGLGYGPESSRPTYMHFTPEVSLPAVCHPSTEDTDTFTELNDLS